MLQLRKSRFCGISAIFLQCCFMSETKVLMKVSDFSGVFSRNNFLEADFTFQCRDLFFSWGGGASFLSEVVLHGDGIGFDGGGFQKKLIGLGGGGSTPSMGNSLLRETLHV